MTLFLLPLFFTVTLQVVLEPFVVVHAPRFAQRQLPPLTPLDFASDGSVKVTFLSINDVYELLPTSELGGLARVATLKKNLLAKGGPVLCTLAGDYLSPSALGTVKVKLPKDGKEALTRLAGRQMVDVFNHFVDIATFGNHEFDVKLEEFEAQIEASQFVTVATNVYKKTNMQLFNGTVPFLVKEMAGVRFGFVSLTINSTMNTYAWIPTFTDSVKLLKQQITTHKQDYDVLIVLTHQTVDSDGQLATLLEDTGVDMIIGGHMHQNFLIYRGNKKPIRITEADSNAHTAYIHVLTIGSDKKLKSIESNLQVIDSSLPDDPVVLQRAQYWTELGRAGFQAAGFDPTAVVTVSPVVLNAVSRIIEVKSTELTDLVGQAILGHFPESHISIFNAGALRLDDLIMPGPVTQYDILRLVPYENHVWLTHITGELLIDILSIGTTKNSGYGAFIHCQGVIMEETKWFLTPNKEPVHAKQQYLVATTDYILSGHEVNLGFINLSNPGIQIVDQTVDTSNDLRNLIMKQLQLTYGKPPVK